MTVQNIIDDQDDRSGWLASLRRGDEVAIYRRGSYAVRPPVSKVQARTAAGGIVVDGVDYGREGFDVDADGRWPIGRGRLEKPIPPCPHRSKRKAKSAK